MKRRKNFLCDGKSCSIEVSLEVIGGMWKTLIIRELMSGTRRYSEIHRALAPVTHKMLDERDEVLGRTRTPSSRTETLIGFLAQKVTSAY